MKKIPRKWHGWMWAGAWLALILLGVDFYNWNQTPRLFFGMPGWLWRLIGVVLLVALVYGFLSLTAWEDE